MIHPRSSILIIALALSLTVFGCSHDSSGDSLLGTSSNSLLSGETYTFLRVEIDYVDGRPPSPAALSILERRLNERCNKPGGIEIVVDDAIPPVASPTSVAAAAELERLYRDDYAEGTRAVLYVLYVNGDAEGAPYLGWAYGPTSITMFGDTIDDASGPTATAAEIEAASLVHEVGHVLGLVNRGAPMAEFHEDLHHRGHDTNRSCVMHYRIETTNVSFLGMNDGAPPNDFDAACIADLRLNGGR